MSTKAPALVGVVVAILIVGAVAVLGYYQVEVASRTSSATSVQAVTCPSAQCVNVTIPSGASTPPSGYSQGAKTTYGFTPNAITLVIGKNNTIYWTNGDSGIHTATSDQGSPDSFDTGNINGGASAQVTLMKAGTYTYHCTYHAWMQGKIIVLPAPASTTSTTTH